MTDIGKPSQTIYRVDNTLGGGIGCSTIIGFYPCTNFDEIVERVLVDNDSHARK